MQIEASKANYTVIMLVFCILLFLMVVVSLGMGRLHIAPMDVFKILCSYVVPVEQSWSDQAASVIYTLRLPRVLAAILIGAALSLLFRWEPLPAVCLLWAALLLFRVLSVKIR